MTNLMSPARGAPLPVSFTLHNRDEENVLFSLGREPQTLRLTITNSSRADLLVPSGEAVFDVGFSPGVLADTDGIGLAADDWVISNRGVTGPDAKFYVTISCSAGCSLAAGGSLEITMTGLQVKPGRGSHGTLVALRYRGLRPVGSTGSLSNVAAHHLAIVQAYPPALWTLDRHASTDDASETAKLTGLEHAVIELRDAVLAPIVVEGGGLLTRTNPVTLRLRANPDLMRAGAGGVALSLTPDTTITVSSVDALVQVAGLAGWTETVDANMARIMTMDPGELMAATLSWVEKDRELTRIHGDFYTSNHNLLAGAIGLPLVDGMYTDGWFVAVERLIELGQAYLGDAATVGASHDDFLAAARRPSQTGWTEVPGDQLISAGRGVQCGAGAVLTQAGAAVTLDVDLRDEGPPRMVTLRLWCQGVQLSGEPVEFALNVPIMLGVVRDDRWNVSLADDGSVLRLGTQDPGPIMLSLDGPENRGIDLQMVRRDSANAVVESVEIAMSDGFSIYHDDERVIGIDRAGNVGIGITESSARLQVGGRVKDATGWLVPVGTVVAYAGREQPEGWLVCNGQDITDATYAELRVVLGSDNVPDLRGTFVVGSNPDDTDYELLKSGGQASVTLSEPEMPVHTHGYHDYGHQHDVVHETLAPVYEQAGAAERAFRVLKAALPTDTVVSGRGFWTHPASTGIQITETGESAPHENRPPFRALNYIIKY